MFSVELPAAALDVLSRKTGRLANIFFRPPCRHRPMADDDHNSMSAILTRIKRAFAPGHSRARELSRVPEPSRASEPASVVEPAALSEPTRHVDYRWEGTRGLF